VEDFAHGPPGLVAGGGDHNTQCCQGDEVGKTTDAEIQDCWRLRPATCDDVTGLHALASMPMVYRYLFDGDAPDKKLIANRIARGIENRENAGFGMWVLERPSAPHVGCVELRPYPSPRTTEITYLLDPRYWGARSRCENGMDSNRARLWLVADQRRCGGVRSTQCCFAGRDASPRDAVSPERPVPTRSRR
jgi:hypothetical protein